ARLSAYGRGRVLAWAVVGVLALGLCLDPLLSAVQTVPQLTTARAYAAAWDELDRQVLAARARGERDITVGPLPSMGNVQNLDFVGPDRGDWFNGCVARYYAVSSIAANV